MLEFIEVFTALMRRANPQMPVSGSNCRRDRPHKTGPRNARRLFFGVTAAYSVYSVWHFARTQREAIMGLVSVAATRDDLQSSGGD